MRSLHKAGEEAIPLIRELAFEIWPLAYGHILSAEQLEYMLSKFYSQESLASQMQQGHQFRIVTDNETVVGFTSFSKEKEGVFKLQKLYVLASEQGKGTGKYILDEIIREIRSLQATALLLNVNRQNKAKLFYEKMGFSVIREEDIPIGNDYFMNDFIMEKKL